MIVINVSVSLVLVRPHGALEKMRLYQARFVLFILFYINT